MKVRSVIVAYGAIGDGAIMHRECEHTKLPELINEAIEKGAQAISIRIIKR